MFRSNQPRIAHFRTDYAKHADFCEVFEQDTRLLYLLAFLLTTNHKESEQCFVVTVEEALKEETVFKEWARSWVRRRMIENAAGIVSPASGRNGQERDLWSAGHAKQGECEIDNCDRHGPVRALRLCHVDPGAPFKLGLLSVTGMQHDQNSSSADESIVPTSRPRRNLSPRRCIANASSRSHGVTISRQTRATGRRPSRKGQTPKV